MKLSEVIKILQSKLDAYGDMECYTNGEHGIGESKIMESDNISVDYTELMFDTCHLDIEDGIISCHIGGY